MLLGVVTFFSTIFCTTQSEKVKKLEFRERIKEIAKDQRLNLREFAARIDVTYRTLQNYMGGQSVPKSSFYESICEEFGVSANWLLMEVPPKYSPPAQSAEDASVELVTIPRLNVEASAGHGSVLDSEMDVGAYAFKRDWIERRGLVPNKLSIIAISGNSMEPDLYDGDLVLLDHHSTELVDSNIYAVRYSGALYVKRIQHQPGDKVLLISKNKDYPPIEIAHPIADGVEVIGRIVASMHEW